MKKFIALLLALVMAFSVTVVAFAAEEDTGSDAEVTTPGDEPTYGELGWTEEEIIDFVMNLPAGAVLHGAKMIIKVAKIAIKIALVLDKLHIIDLSPIKNAIFNMVADMIKDIVESQLPEDPTEPDVTQEQPAA